MADLQSLLQGPPLGDMDSTHPTITMIIKVSVEELKFSGNRTMENAVFVVMGGMIVHGNMKLRAESLQPGP